MELRKSIGRTPKHAWLRIAPQESPGVRGDAMREFRPHLEILPAAQEEVRQRAAQEWSEKFGPGKKT
jgi:hypothetical protein